MGHCPTPGVTVPVMMRAVRNEKHPQGVVSITCGLVSCADGDIEERWVRYLCTKVHCRLA
jgi:hypothetical protein